MMARIEPADRWAIGGLLAVHFAYGATLWVHREFFCISDCTIEMLPRLIAFARSLQAGSLAWWDPNTFAGARQFWMSGGAPYYPLLYPLYLLTPTDDPQRAATLLQLLPYVVHLGSASVGTYLFARLVLACETRGAVAAALVFGFATPLRSTEAVILTQGYSYLPWILLAATRCLESGSRRWWAFGAALIAAMCSASSPDMISRMLFLVALQSGLFWLFARRYSSPPPSPRRLLSLMPMVVLGMGAFAFGLSGALQGVRLLLQPLSLTCDRIARFNETSSLDPLSLLSLVLPGPFIDIWALANLSFGALSMTAVLFAVGGRRDELSPPESTWAGIAGITGLFLLLILLGYHTPIFGLACTVLPPFFGFPHPIYYMVGLSWALAILAGIGVSRAVRGGHSPLGLMLRTVPVLIACAVIGFRPAIPSVQWTNLFASSWLYPAMALAAASAVVAGPSRLRGTLLLFFLAAEMLVGPFDFACSLPRRAGPPQMMDYHDWRIGENPLVELLPALRRITAGDQARFVGSRSVVSNLAWLVNGRALLGQKPEPLMPEFRRAAVWFTANAPYELWLLELPQFLANMNVGYLVAEHGYPSSIVQGRPEGQITIEEREEPYGVVEARLKAAIASLPLVESTEHYEIRALPSPLPYVYTQDDLQVASDEDQFIRLMRFDLREAAYLTAETLRQHPELMMPRGPSSSRGGVAERFAELQAANRVIEVKRPDGNHKSIVVEMSRPALLVINEVWNAGWRARVDGISAPLVPVNIVQQGVRLEAGRHQVELVYRPRELILAWVVSAVCVGCIVAVGLFRRAPRSRERQGVG